MMAERRTRGNILQAGGMEVWRRLTQEVRIVATLLQRHERRHYSCNCLLLLGAFNYWVPTQERNSS